MLNFTLIKNLLVIAMAVSTTTVIFIQKTKRFIPKSSLIPIYSLLVNLIVGYFFSKTFSDIKIIESIWVGLFSFLGADTIYTSLEGKISSYSEIIGEIQYEK